ncbi:MAG: hypothetical protein EHM70_23335 [Chloroflexota bacterium]|nr:MAG: hypothetical protein EHM70_23335 [Chloroflexota bacterium]
MSRETGKKFVVLTSQRSGSTWLISVLNQIEGVSAYGELFLRRKSARSENQWDTDFARPRFVETEFPNLMKRPLTTFAYLNDLYHKPGAVGFKLMYSHMAKHPELLAYFMLRRIRVVHLVRHNCLDVLISRAVKRKMNRAHVIAGQPEAGEVQVEMNPESLIRRLDTRTKKMMNARKMLKWSGLPSIEVGYEDLTRDGTAFQNICNFLSINSGYEIPKSKFVKIRQRSQAEVISNYAEIIEALKGTPYEGFLEEREDQSMQVKQF